MALLFPHSLDSFYILVDAPVVRRVWTSKNSIMGREVAKT
jgi:hypothetical protein